MSHAMLLNSGYEAPAVLSHSDNLPYQKDWAIIGMALVLVLAIFGSAGAFCWAVCHGKVSSCGTSGPFWARSVQAHCHP